jgi:presenilin-like A22 family membrane protease
MRKELPAVAAMCCLFVIAVMVAMVTSYILPAEYQVFGEDTDNAWNILYLFAVIIVFTAVILAIAKWWKARLIQVIILFAVGMTVLYVAWPPLWLVLGDYNIIFDGIADLGFVIAAVLGILTVILLYKYPEWWVIDITGVIMAAGTTAIFGISLVPSVAIMVLVVFAVYDYIAVHKTRHMVSLAENVMDQRLPVLLVIPKSLPYSFLHQKPLKKQLAEKSEREAMFMGLGDIVFPGMLAVSSLYFLEKGVHTAIGLDGNILVALSVLAGCLVGFVFLMRTVLKGDPQPGLPLLNGGAIISYLVSAYMVYGSTFGLTMPTF